VDEVTQVLSRLTDLAEVWSSKALLVEDRIELWPLLQKAWAQVEPLARSRGLKVRFTSMVPTDQLATLYGSEHWLQRVFLECLESAVRTTPSGGILDIEHRQMGPRVLIVLRDSCVFAPARSDATELPAAHTGATRLGPRDMIGLKLCQQVVALHGGQLREEENDGVRNFLIDLPTGAPYRTQPLAETDIAQAQRYAADLAALMARRRTAPDRLGSA
jgi:signal transduction histidine kinase